ncbi:MAG: hypothetical protein RL033_6416 [Pseudomonadota bacterium]
MRTLSHWLERSGRWLAAAAVFALPWQALSGSPLNVLGSLLAFDLLVMLAACCALPGLWRQRVQLLRCPAAWQVLAFAAAGLGSEPWQDGPDLARRLAEQAAPLAAVLVLGWAASEPRPGLLERAALAGGGLALGLSLLGWWLDRATGLSWFSDLAPHHVFAGLPRLFGTFGGSPQRCGSFAVYWLALLLAMRSSLPRRLWALALAVGASALLLSMSYAWLGGLVLAAVQLPRRWRTSMLVVAALAVGVASVPIHLGPESPPLRGPCPELDAQHLLAVYTGRGQCQRLSPSGRAITLYREAKRVSWQAWRERPWVGVGYVGFADFSRRAFQREYGAPGIHYTQPHGVFHGLPAKHGVLGVLALLVWLAALVRGWRGSSWDWGVVAFLVIGLHIDVDRLRELWALLGFLLSEQWRAASDVREATAAAADALPGPADGSGPTSGSLV